MRSRAVSGLMLALLSMSVLIFTFNIQRTNALEPPATEWTRTYGGVDNEEAYSVIQTEDGGYALAGWTESYGSGSYDIWLVKVDMTGALQWNRTFGGGWSLDEAFSIVETMDGGYALAGRTASALTGSWDFYLVKTDSSGNLEWSTPYGGANDDSSYSVVQTSDGGYALAGATDSIDFGYDFYLVKIDSFGDFEWSKTYGGTNNEMARCVVQTSDGGYALTGYTDSYGSNGRDAWLVKTDSSGNVQWNRTYGGASTDHANSVVETSDGGYALAGCTFSFYPWGFWLVKTDPSGNAQWNKTYGGGNIGAYSLVQTDDSGYALAGTVIDVGARLVKTDATGIMQWSKTFGGPGVDGGQSVVQTNDGGFALAGYTSSYGAGEWDFLLIKVAGPPKFLISIVSPENKTYLVEDVPLTLTVDEPPSWIGYSLDGQLNVTVAGNSTLSGLLDGFHYVVVYANDTEGNMEASSTVYFTVDTAPPNITDVSQTPLEDNVLPEDKVQVNATVTDDLSGVKQVTLNYTNGNGTWVNVDMTNLEGNLWNATIPKFPYCTNVTYVITAEDHANNTVTTEEVLGHQYQYHVIPEFPSLLLLSLFIIATLATVFYVRRRKHELNG